MFMEKTREMELARKQLLREIEQRLQERNNKGEWGNAANRKRKKGCLA